MLLKIPKEKIDNYQEDWQRSFYLISGDEEYYFQHCEVCYVNKEIEKIPGGHYICNKCLKKLKLPKEPTIIKWAKAQLKFAEAPFHLKNIDIAEPSKIERNKAWSKIIKYDYNIAMFNKIKDNLNS